MIGMYSLRLFSALILFNILMYWSVYPWCLRESPQDTLDVRQSVYDAVRQSFEQQNSEGIAVYFAPVVKIALLSEEILVSRNQAEALLKHFMATHRIISFSYTTVQLQASPSYALGTVVWIEKGKKQSTPLYVVLEQEGGSWFISQFCMYE